MGLIYDGGDGPVTSINNYFSAGSVSQDGIPVPPHSLNVKETLSGALTAGTLATALSITGRGVARFIASKTKDATARTIRLKVTVDGTSVFDATTNSMSASNKGIIAVGGVATGGSSSDTGGVYGELKFNTSLLVEHASSPTETDKISLISNYDVWAS